MPTNDFGHKAFEAGGFYPEKYTRKFWEGKSGYLARKIWELLRPMKVFDIGCGMGFLIEDLRSYGIKAYGIDANGYAISNASEKAKPFLKQRSIENLLPQIGDEEIDVVVSSAMVYLDEIDIDKVLKEINRITKKWFISFGYLKGNPGEPDPYCRIRWTLAEWNEKYLAHGFRYHGDYLYEKIRKDS